MGDVLNRGTRDKPLWYARYKDENNVRRCVHTRQPTKILAEQFLAEVEARIRRGQVGIEDRRTQAAILGELIDRFLVEYSRPRIKDIEVYRGETRTCFNRLPEDWRRRPASSITQQMVAEFRDQLGRAGAKSVKEGYQANTITHTLRALSTLYNWARKKTLINVANPCSGVERARMHHLLEYLGATDRQEIERLLIEARARCWGSTSSLPAVLYPMVAIALFTGLRKGELFALRWRDLDVETRRLDIMKAVVRGGKIGLPKGGKPRHLRLPKVLVPILQEWRPLCPPTPEGLVLPVPIDRCARSAERVARLTEAAIGKGEPARNARKMLARLGESAAKWRIGSNEDMVCLPELLDAAKCSSSAVGRDWHLLRHTFASHYIMKGGNILTLQHILGHSDIKMTMLYAHLAPDFLAEEMDRVAFEAVTPPASVDQAIVVARPQTRRTRTAAREFNTRASS